MPPIIIPLNVFDSYKELYKEVPLEFPIFMKGLQTGNNARKPLTYQMNQNRATNKPPEVRTIVLELLNKMTTDNVSRTIDTIAKLKIITTQDLETVSEYIFKFATSKQDARMSQAYANLLKGLLTIQVGEKKLVVQLLDQCQYEFLAEIEKELVEHKDLAIVGVDSDADGHSKAFKIGLVQFIGALSANGVLREDVFDMSLGKLLAVCCKGTEKVDIRIETAVRMAILVKDRYKKNSNSELVKKNIEMFKDIAEKRVTNVGAKARFAVCDYLESIA
jgi:hypothetical protein